MTVLRWVFAVAGAAALAWGGWLAWDFTASSLRSGVNALFWFVGGPLLHDLLVAPVVGALGLLLARYLPRAWRAPVAVGAVVSGVLTLLAVPLLWYPRGAPVNPGLHDADYGRALLITLGVVWLLVIIVAAVSSWRTRAPAIRGGRTRAGEG